MPKRRPGTDRTKVRAINVDRALTREKLATASLVAVNDSVSFWERHGFRKITTGKVVDATLIRKLRGYGLAATFMVRQL